MISQDIVFYTIYDHPKDFPNEFVCRKHRINCLGNIHPELDLFARGPTLASVREKLPPGLVCFQRDLADDAVIVESWMQ